MILQAGFFFNIDNIEYFCQKELFDISKFNKLDITFNHKVVQSINDCFWEKEDFAPLKKYKGVIYKQKNSLIVYKNNISDNWITNIEYTAEKYNKKAVYINIDSETNFPGYQLYFFNGIEKRIIYSIKDGSKWIFFNKGSPQNFEKNDMYIERGATKKFNIAKLKFFCHNLGIEIDDPDLLKPVDKVIYTYTS